jgi:hypothetical protein
MTPDSLAHLMSRELAALGYVYTGVSGTDTEAAAKVVAYVSKKLREGDKAMRQERTRGHGRRMP